MILKCVEIQKVETFRAVCSCGNQGPIAIDEHDAIALAKDDGWQHWTVSREGEQIEAFRCDECFEKLIDLQADEQDEIIESLDPENQ